MTSTLAFGPVYQLGAALDYLAGVGVDRIERHTVDLAHRLQEGLVERGFEVRTPKGNRSSILTFNNKEEQQSVARLLESEEIRVSFREEGTQIRVGLALYNNKSEVKQFLEVMGKTS